MFTGSITALITPWLDGKLDEAAFRRFIDWQIGQGTQGIIPCGTTGESATFSHEEQHRTIALAVAAAAGRVPVIAGAGSNCTREAVSLTQAATRLGANGILSITPYYNKPNQEGLFQHFRAVREATDLPLVLYNVPSRTGISLAPDTVARIAALGNIAAVKDATGDLAYARRVLERGVGLLSGNDDLTWPLMAIGAAGVISVVANFAPAIMRRLCDAAAAGDVAQARALHHAVCELSDHAFADTNPIPAKTAVAALGHCREEFRLPLVPLDAGRKAALLTALRRHGLLA
jgi:4-hydroxy-tetrahydrodipicolinate synthase